MTRPAPQRGISLGAITSAQAGFTLIELLVTMLLSIVVLGGGTWGMARAFRSSSETTSRTAATNQAEVRFEVLTRDLRDAVTCPTPLYVIGGGTFDGTRPTAIFENSLPTYFSVQFCEPAPGLPPSSSASQLPQSAFVTWICNQNNESCTRQIQAISGNSVTGPLITTNTITGVVSISLTGLVTGYGFPSPIPVTITTLGVANFTSGDYYQVVPPTYFNTIYWLTWVGITAQIASLKAPENSNSNLAQATGTSPVTFTTGVSLRNAITS